MVHHVRSRIASSVPFAVALLTVACQTGAPMRGVPLYANVAAPMPRTAVAELVGPIGKVDGRDVAGQGGVFELLPGCHVVELDRRPVNSDNVSTGMYVNGEYPLVTYAIRMKAGATYVIRRDISGGMGTMLELRTSAQEEDARGRVTDLNPMQSVDEIQACKQSSG